MFRTTCSQRFLVTGGTGLGRIMVEKFVEIGADCGRVAAASSKRQRDRLWPNTPSVGSTPHTVDIRAAMAVEEMIERIWAHGAARRAGGNNAAAAAISQTKDLSPAPLDAIANIVLQRSARPMPAAKRWIAGERKASVLSILTTWVWTGSPFVVPSAVMSKGWRRSDDSKPRRRMGRHGIRLNAIAPGPFPTEGRVGALNPIQEVTTTATDAQPDGPRRPTETPTWRPS